MISKILLVVVCLMFMVGCAASIKIVTQQPLPTDVNQSPIITVTAKDMTVIIDPKTGTVNYTPNRWFTTAAIASLFQSVTGMATTVAPVVAPLVTK